MALSLLQMCTQALEEVGVDPPTAIVSGNDLGVQLLGLANTTGRMLSTRYDWRELRAEGTFTTTASQELQSTLTTDFPNLRKFHPESVWNRTQQRRLFPLSPQGWTRVKADGVSPSINYYYLRGQQFLMPSDTVVGSETIAFEYQDKRWCSSSDGLTLRDAFANDADISRLDDYLMVLGIRWRFMARKGLDYAEQMREFEDYLSQMIADNNPHETLSVNPNHRNEGKDSQIPDGNWNQ